MGAIQSSINQLVGIASLGAYASRQSIKTDAEREKARTEQIHLKTPPAVGEDGEGSRTYTAEELEAHRSKEYKGGQGIIGDLRDIKTERQLQKERVSVTGPGYEDLMEDEIAATRNRERAERYIQRTRQAIADRAAQAQKAKEFRETVKRNQLGDLLQNPNATKEDFEKWRNR